MPHLACCASAPSPPEAPARLQTPPAPRCEGLAATVADFAEARERGVPLCALVHLHRAAANGIAPGAAAEAGPAGGAPGRAAAAPAAAAAQEAAGSQKPSSAARGGTRLQQGRRRRTRPRRPRRRRTPASWLQVRPLAAQGLPSA
jgi:hypothetical protein